MLIRLQGQHIASIPAGHDRGLTGEADVAGKGGAEATDIGASGSPTIPPQHLLTNPTGDGERYLAVAFAGRGGLQLSDTLFQIRAAVVDEETD